MGAHAYVTLIAAGIAITAAAAYLIWVIKILWVVIDRLTVILGAVQAVIDKSQPIGPIVDEINRDLDRGAKALQASVRRLEERKAPAGAAAGDGRAHTESGAGGAPWNP